ncbi:MAG: polyprenyl synthetase family protein [Chloroflexi bacterium]|nr:polyprenyl synthetase family protein [Chloroflexota bacterium]
MAKPEAFESYRTLIETELQSNLDCGRLGFYDMHRYHLGWVDDKGRAIERQGGKFIRSTLCLSSCKAAGGNISSALPAAAAVELVHNFSLIHDDIQDRSDLRRHRPAVWKVWGTAQGINAGDSMYAMAHVALTRLADRGVSDTKIVRAAATLGRTCLLLCEGQYQDILYEARHEISVEEYLDMVARKTGALMGASAELGALVGSYDDRVIEELGDFGIQVGIAFQAQDDVMGIWGREEETGKQQYDDIVGKKKTLPVIYALKKAGRPARQKLLSVYAEETVSLEDAAGIVDILHDCGAYDYSRNIANQHLQRALANLEHVPNSQGKKELVDIASFLIEGRP